MSSIYVWDDIPAEIRQSIEAQMPRDVSAAGSHTDKQCGCHERGDAWWLCQYHVGMIDGFEIGLET